MKKIIAPFFFLLMYNAAFSQKIKGRVLDFETKKPIEKAHIQIHKKIFFSDEKGRFSYTVPEKWDKKIKVTHVSYKPLEIKYEGKKKRIIYLKPKAELLDDVVVVGKLGNRKLKYLTLSELPQKLYSFASTVFNNKIYVFGGDKSNEVDALKKVTEERPELSMIAALDLARNYRPFYSFSNQLFTYDLNKKKWIKEDLTFRKKASHSAALVGDKIYLIGGKRLTKSKRQEYLDEKIEVFDPIKKTVEVDHTNPHQAVDLQTIVYKEKIYVFGGSIKKKDNGKKYYSEKIHSYNPKTGKWFLLAEIPFSEETVSCLVDDKIYFFDGFDNNKNINTITSLSLTTGKLKPLGRIFYNFEQPAITKDKKTIFIFENGKLLTINTQTKEIKEYSIDLFLYASKIYIVDDFLYILGGYTRDDFEIFPQKRFFKVDLNSLSKTRAKKYIKLKT
ncbi:MAG: carboxypeptidase-like regulatory domain-containing protein [Flavobacteriaceae bacterium]